MNQEAQSEVDKGKGGRLNGFKHGHASPPSRTYQTWRGMITRCTKPNHKEFPNYGGRGIKVCAKWREFAQFLADMGEKPEGLTIERKNVNGNYEPSNCCWATREEQNNNTRRNRLVTFQGETMTVTRWAARVGLHYKTLTERLDSGWSVELALTVPRGSRKMGVTSRYRGVCRNICGGKPWQAAITVGGKTRHLGKFDTEEAAARTYNQNALLYFGEHAFLNKI